jgi:hypothetical protein
MMMTNKIKRAQPIKTNDSDPTEELTANPPKAPEPVANYGDAMAGALKKRSLSRISRGHG